MKLFKRKLFYIIILIIALIAISLVFVNTILSNYNNKLNGYLNTYFETQDEDSITGINNIIDRYQNNKKRTKQVNSIIASSISKWINKYNDSYDNIDDLNNKASDLSNKITYLLNNIHDIHVTNKLDKYITEINSLQASKTSYIKGMTSYTKNDYNSAYTNFINVIDEDSYYEDTRLLIDDCLSTTLNRITNEVNKLTTIDDEATDEDKIPVYTNIFNYLINELNTSNYKLDKSKKFSDLLNDNETSLINTYVSYAKYLAGDNKYDEASNLLNEGIKLLNKGDIDVAPLTDLLDAYNLMQSVSLVSLTAISKTGDWIKTDANPDDKALIFYKGLKKSYVKNTITYNINKEYVNLDINVSLGNDMMPSQDSGTIKIKGDNKTLKNITINSDLEEDELNLDLKNVNNLTFEYTIKYNEDNDYEEPVINVILGNPILNKY